MGSTWGQPGVNLGSTWGQPGVNLGSTWGQSGVNLHCPTVAVLSAATRITVRPPSSCRGLHSSTFRLNISTFCGMGDVQWVLRGCSWGAQGVFRGD